MNKRGAWGVSEKPKVRALTVPPASDSRAGLSWRPVVSMRYTDEDKVENDQARECRVPRAKRCDKAAAGVTRGVVA